MIKKFVKISLKDSSKGKINEIIQTQKSIVLNYPCSNSSDCTPYVLTLSKGVYKFECWGSKGGQWIQSGRKSNPGLGGYTSGTLFVSQPTMFYVYIGNVGFFNAVKEIKANVYGAFPGGATDVRLTYSENWWDNYSLISRIMVAAGGGGAEWSGSFGGNGGGLTGGESISYVGHCPGATQTNGSECVSVGQYSSKKGEFGSAGKPEPITMSIEDYGGFGGGGYYGGTSYQYAFAGSGGSSFISGHKGCDAVKDQTEPIEHTGQPNHYSGIVFSDTKMISGNETMPLPNDPTKRDIYSDEGAFRITLIMYQYQCTYKRSLYHHSLINVW